MRVPRRQFRSRQARAQAPRGRSGRPCCCAGACSPRRASSRFLYYQPLSSYLETRATLNERTAEVQAAAPGARRLQARLEHSATVEALSREARRMSLVRPGERLFIVKGIASGAARTRALRSGKSAMDDRALVERQLGRPPRAFRRVAARCPFGAPAVTEQAPYDDAGEPVPDDVLPHLPAARGRDRAARGGGRRRALERRARARIPSSPPTSSARPTSSGGSAASSRRGQTGRDGGSSLELGIGGSANPRRLKCLHAHAAFALAQPGLRARRADARRARARSGRRNAAAPRL